MTFWDNIGKSVGGFFSGLFGQKKKNDDQNQQNNRVNTPSIKSSSINNISSSQANINPNTSIKTNTPNNLFKGISNDISSPGIKTVNQSTQSNQNTVSPKNVSTPAIKVNQTKVTPTQQTLNNLTDKNLSTARDQVNKGSDLWGRVTNFFTGNGDKLAQQRARNMAVSQYQSKYGYNNPEVNQYINKTALMEKNTQKGIKTQNDTIDSAIKTGSSIPVLSDFMTLGSGAAAGLYKLGGNKQLADDSHNNWTKATLGMSDEEVAKLPQESQTRLRNLQKGLTVASPIMGGLDISSLGSSAAAINGIKAAAASGAKGATAQEVKNLIKSTGKNAIIAGVTAPVIGAPIENYIRTGNGLDFNGYNASNIPREAGTAALWSTLMPTGSKAKNSVVADAESAMKDVKNSKEPTNIDVKKIDSIGVKDESPNSVQVPVKVSNTDKTGTPVIDVTGDTPGVNKVTVKTPEEVTAAKVASQPVAHPDESVGGIITNKNKIITQNDIDTAQQTIDDMAKTGKITEDQQKSLTTQLSQIQAQDAKPSNTGTKIDVKKINSIPVENQTVVSTDAGTPNTVRNISNTAPTNDKTASVAAQTIPQITPETRTILDNPKQFNRRQVLSARNQAKLAKQYAKAQESVSDSMGRINEASVPAQSGEGFVSTGEFAKTRKSGVYQKVNRQSEMAQAVQETATMSPAEVVNNARANQSQTGQFTRRDIRNIAALFEQKRLQRGTPEFEQARQILREDGTNWGQTGALRNYTIRRTAKADELISRFESKIYRLADDPSKIDSKLFDDIDSAETNYTDTRDAALAAYNKFTESPTKANTEAYHAAQDAADAADKQARMTEYKVASRILKGNKDIQQAREIEKMAQSADMSQMDAVDASMLSGTGTFVRNFINSAIGGAEEGLFGKVGAKIASGITKESVGGGVGKNSLSGFINGVKDLTSSSKARASVAGLNPLEHIKNFATTGNELGDSIIDSQVSHNVYDHYYQLLKDQGYKGEELRNRASVMSRQDPEIVTLPNGSQKSVSQMYTDAARVSAGLGSGVTRNNRIESWMTGLISDHLPGGPNQYTENIGKLVTRMTIGFPTAIGRASVEGVKRLTAGTPTFIKAAFTKDPQAKALLIKEGVKQLGTGAVAIPGLFTALGSMGVITGSYPSDSSERDRWEREGITENSIKIGNNYYQLPSYLGTWAIPALFYASLGRNNGDMESAVEDTAKIIPSLLPTDQMSNVQDVINGRSDFGKFMSQTGASTVRAMTPGGALLNQIAKTFDNTKNDTSDGSVVENFMDKVLSGVPGLSNTVENKVDSNGNTISNPDPLSLALGASSASQQKGVEETNAENSQTNSQIDTMAGYGLFSDPNIKKIITDSDTKKIYNKIISGDQVSADDLKKVQEAVTKGVSASDDTAYLEKEQYDTNIAVLQAKRDLLANDPTTKPSDLDKIDIAIKRGQVYKENSVPYDLIKEYQSTGLSEWRKMGDPDSDSYDPDTYQRLWSIDELMTNSGVSYKSGGKLTTQKYSAKSSSSSSGKSSTSNLNADFGTIDGLSSAPTVQQYDTISTSGDNSIPIIQVERPNIVHKIGVSG